MLDVAPPLPAIDPESSALTRLAASGLLGLCLVIALFVIRHLYNTNREDARQSAQDARGHAAREKELLGQIDRLRVEHAGVLAQQQNACALEIEKLVSSHERESTKLAQEYAESIAALNAEARSREDALRRDLIAVVKDTEAARDKAIDKVSLVLEKLANKVVPT